MTARKKIILGSALVALVGGVAWELWRLRIPDPIYDGHPLSYWFEEGHGPMSGNAAVGEQITDAVRHVGTNAIPLLLHFMRARDSALKRRLIMLADSQSFIRCRIVSEEGRHNQAEWGFEALGSDGASAVPELMRVYQMNLSLDSQRSVIEALGCIGPGARLAIPLLIDAATNSAVEMRSCASLALGQVRLEPDVVVPVLTNCLHDPYLEVRAYALQALGDFGPQAESAVPLLLGLLTANLPVKNESFLPVPQLDRVSVEEALIKIDPVAAANAGIQMTNASPTQ
jgi:hypothetical protein